jgi:hypothetical protein
LHPLAVFRIDDYVPDVWRPKYDDYKTSFVDLLVRTGIIYAPTTTQSDRPGSSCHALDFGARLSLSFLAELARARTSHAAMLDEIKGAEKKLSSAQESLNTDWGRNWEWKKLDGTCVEQNLGE